MHMALRQFVLTEYSRTDRSGRGINIGSSGLKVMLRLIDLARLIRIWAETIANRGRSAAFSSRGIITEKISCKRRRDSRNKGVDVRVFVVQRCRRKPTWRLSRAKAYPTGISKQSRPGSGSNCLSSESGPALLHRLPRRLQLPHPCRHRLWLQ